VGLKPMIRAATGTDREARPLAWLAPAAEADAYEGIRRGREGAFRRVAEPLQPVLPGKGYKPVVVPNGRTLPFKIVDGVKVFHLIAEAVEHYFDSGLRAKCWAYNGYVSSAVIEAVEGERVRIYVTNRLPVATSVHWHGIYLPNGMDGVGGLTQPYIKPGETAKYEYTLRQHGTFMFHSHHDEMTQMGMGLIGMFVIHPRQPAPERQLSAQPATAPCVATGYSRLP
jgi:manganese oxidase